jgi:hypothetical protein
MSRMIRKQIYIDADKEALLKQRARELGVSEAELIRRCLNDLERQAAAIAVDRRAWEEELAFMQARSQTVPGRQGHRQWTREELYAERTDRILH